MSKKTEPDDDSYEKFQRELDRTAVISDSFKSHLLVLVRVVQMQAYRRGEEASRIEVKKKARKDASEKRT